LRRLAISEFSCGLGEASGLTGIDLEPGQAGLDQRLLEQAMVSIVGSPRELAIETFNFLLYALTQLGHAMSA